MLVAHPALSAPVRQDERDAYLEFLDRVIPTSGVIFAIYESVSDDPNHLPSVRYAAFDLSTGAYVRTTRGLVYAWIDGIRWYTDSPEKFRFGDPTEQWRVECVGPIIATEEFPIAYLALCRMCPDRIVEIRSTEAGGYLVSLDLTTSPLEIVNTVEIEAGGLVVRQARLGSPLRRIDYGPARPSASDVNHIVAPRSTDGSWRLVSWSYAQDAVLGRDDISKTVARAVAANAAYQPPPPPRPTTGSPDPLNLASQPRSSLRVALLTVGGSLVVGGLLFWIARWRAGR